MSVVEAIELLARYRVRIYPEFDPVSKSLGFKFKAPDFFAGKAAMFDCCVYQEAITDGTLTEEQAICRMLIEAAEAFGFQEVER